MRVIGKAGTWKRRAFWRANQLLKLTNEKILPDDIVNHHYLGGGGCVLPNGTIWPKFDDNDIAYQSLADDLAFMLENISGK